VLEVVSFGVESTRPVAARPRHNAAVRPFKHVAATQPPGSVTRPQNVLGIALTRFQAPWGEIPVAVTTEFDRITLFYWNDGEGRWDSIERRHAPLTTDGFGPNAPPAWNWSDRVGLTASRDTVFAVYKRASVATEQSPSVVQLRVDRFQVTGPAADRRLGLIDSHAIPDLEPGRSLWCDFDPTTGSLVVVVQRARPRRIGTFVPVEWQLTTVRVRFDATGAPTFVQKPVADLGGFDLDARREGRTLFVVHRVTSASTVLPLATMLGAGFNLTSGPDGDQFYPNLALHTLNLDTLDATPDFDFPAQSIPGGGHPQIQRTTPLLITFDRFRTTLRLDPPVPPLPPLRSRVVWTESAIHKIAFLRQNGVDSRGTLLTFDGSAVPRSVAAFSDTTHLLDIDSGVARHAMPHPICPVAVLALDVGRKDLTLDLLHHRERVGLFRTKLSADIGDGQLTVSGSAFEVWDIGHAQIGDPVDLVPDATPENAQFAPAGELPLSASPDALVRPAVADNTIGVNLSADLSREPVGFFGYTDAGDGGLRVIFAPDTPVLPDPPPVDNEKVVRPEQVTGPHVPCEEWVEIADAEVVPSGLPAYFVGIDVVFPSLGSTVEAVFDSLDTAAAVVQRPDGSIPNRITGLFDRDLDDLDAVRLLGTQVEIPLIAADGRAVVVTRTPERPVDGVPFSVAVEVNGAPVPAVGAFTFLPPPGALPGGPGAPQMAIGTPLTLALPFAGQWRMSVMLTDVSPGVRLPDVDFEVGESLRRTVWGLPAPLHRRLEVERVHVSMLQYEIEYVTPPAEDDRHVTINRATERATEMRFRASGAAEQGIVDYDANITVFVPGSGGGATIGRVKNALGLLDLKELRVTFAYGRPFTAGMLMADRRSANVLTQDVTPDGGTEVIRRDDPSRHCAIGGKPFGATSVPRRDTQIRLETNLLNATLASVVTALGIFGLTTLASWIAGLYGLVALAGLLGPQGVILAATVGALLLVALVFLLPRAVESAAIASINETLAADATRQALDRAALLRFAGEGMAEAIALKVLEKAEDSGLVTPGPEADAERPGFQRFKQAFQMVFVADGICRVLVRPERCEAFDVRFPPPPLDDSDDPGDLPTIGRLNVSG
jgi:hypothetical protein